MAVGTIVRAWVDAEYGYAVVRVDEAGVPTHYVGAVAAALLAELTRPQIKARLAVAAGQQRAQLIAAGDLRALAGDQVDL